MIALSAQCVAKPLSKERTKRCFAKENANVGCIGIVLAYLSLTFSCMSHRFTAILVATEIMLAK